MNNLFSDYFISEDAEIIENIKIRFRNVKLTKDIKKAKVGDTFLYADYDIQHRRVLFFTELLWKIPILSMLCEVDMILK